MLPSALTCSTELSLPVQLAGMLRPKLSVAETERRSPTAMVMDWGVIRICVGGGFKVGGGGGGGGGLLEGGTV